MAGNNGTETLRNRKKANPMSVASSTPLDIKDGVEKKVSLSALAKYEVNIRVFHPNKNFEGWGFRFHGDNRGFSLGESWFGTAKQSIEKPTSRIWQRYLLDLSIKDTGDLTKHPSAKHEVESNFSDSGPGIWSPFSWNGENYTNLDYKPRGKIQAKSVEVPHAGQKTVRISSHLAGENHAFLTSTTQQDILGTTVVPTLDAYSDLFIRVERVEGYMDIFSLTYGDGFPNCESFLKDSTGNHLFLGTRVRIGYPATHLWKDKNNRLIWANAIRIEIDKDGNFGEKLWVFAQALGGSPYSREKYPVNSLDEFCNVRIFNKEIKTEIGGLVPAPIYTMFWNCGDAKEIAHPQKNGSLPLYLSAYTPSLQKISELVNDAWKLPPKKKITRTQWNEYHLYRDPNEGRYSDDPEYQVADEKWAKTK